MLRPSYTISLGSATLSSDTLEPLATLVVECAQNAGADSAVLGLGLRPDLALAGDEPVAIELGWDGDTELVFTGTVAAVERRIDGLVVTCAGSHAPLTRMRADTTFVRQSAGQIVAALAADAGVATATVEDGSPLPVYVADCGRTHYAHCLRLARWCGFGLYAGADGTLAFRRFAERAPARTLRYGADVIRASVRRAPAADTATVVPESPSSSQGDETASWLVKDAASQAGGGSGTATVSAPALRTKEAATTAAQALADRAASSAVGGRVEIAGAPALALGDTVALDGMPDSELDDTYEVRGVRHVLDRRRGFRTQLRLGGTP